MGYFTVYPCNLNGANSEKNVPLKFSYSQKELWVFTQASCLSSFSNLLTVVLAPGCGKLDLQGLCFCLSLLMKLAATDPKMLSQEGTEEAALSRLPGRNGAPGQEKFNRPGILNSY